jgi:hypothetical protein
MDYGDWRLGPPQLDPKVQAMAQALQRPAPPPDNGYWQKTWEGALNNPEIFVVDKHPYGEGVKGWTVCDKTKRQCQIIMLRNANRECVEAHERQHAAGYDHPNYPRAYICPE